MKFANNGANYIKCKQKCYFSCKIFVSFTEK